MLAPLWYSMATGLPAGPCSSESAGATAAPTPVVKVRLLRSKAMPKGLAGLAEAIKSFQMAGESQPSLLRSDILWSEIMNKPPPLRT